MRMRSIVCVGLLLAGAATPARSQWSSSGFPEPVVSQLGTRRAATPPPVAAGSRPLAYPVAGGVVGGAAGLLAGSALGYAAMCGLSDGAEFCGLIGAALGAGLGESLGLGLGVHLGDGRRGRAGEIMLTSALVGLAGGAIAVALDDANFLMPVPLFQLAASIGVSRLRSPHPTR